MTGRNEPPTAVATPHLGGKLAVALFVFTLLSFVAESQLTQYVQTTLDYRQPYLIFYIVHSAFFVLFPLHILYLIVVGKHTSQSLLAGLSIAVSRHLSKTPPSSAACYSSPSVRQALYLSLPIILGLTIGLTVPGLMWFAAISLASISDVTAIWNTNALWCWVFTTYLFKLKWESRRLIAVLLATFGVFIVVYGGSESSKSDSAPEHASVRSLKPTAPLLGDAMTLVASVLYALYQVMYKKYAALPSDPELIAEGLYEPITDDPETTEADALDLENVSYPPPFGLHANLLSSAVGLCTLLVLWIPIPILHYTGIEVFVFPRNLHTVFSIAAIALSGVAFNGGFMILLGLWGPVITSVGNLLTIVLVLITDVLFGGGAETVTVWSLVGSGIIVAAFGLLAYEMVNAR
ncbi:hypothetical protein PLICRDRAFT_165023 [Plicaturopsis crispa FD-325 SS-3]|nr:hypothetical protein PLICRDRAFT_165023 [Plicaturopsis crispa FD-325 SS-3]